MAPASAVKIAHAAAAVVSQTGSTATAGKLWSRDAGEVRVGRAPWAAPPHLPADVHFESLLLQMPDDVWLSATVYLPVQVRSGQRVPALAFAPDLTNVKDRRTYEAT